MKRFFFLMATALLSLAVTAGENDLLWDYTEAAPSSNPDNGLYYASKVADAPSTNNGLNGIKLNSSGYCYFTKAPVAGRLKLTFGPRSGTNKASLQVHTWSDDTPRAETKIAETGEQTELGTQVIELTAEQNNIYITRLLNTETVLQKIQFKEGQGDEPTECEIIFKDQNGKTLGRVETVEGATLEAIPYTEADLPEIAASDKFRGWFYTSDKKAQIGDVIVGNTTIQAKVTAIEVPAAGRVFDYNLTSPTFYPEDHELIDVQDEKIVLRLDGLKTIIVQKSNGQDLFSQDEGSEFVEMPKSGLQAVTLYFVTEFMQVSETGYKIVPAGDAASLLLTMRTLEDGDKVFLPNGLYDLGETVLTTVNAHNVSIIGQSKEGVIIKNAPDYRKESIDKTATLRIAKNVKGTYLQDLTLQNALDYYKNNNGRAVALWDQGTQTICKNVRLLSYQDTYYSNLIGAVKYFETCEIHGTVDFICGDGSVYFKDNLLYCERRNTSGSGSDALTASNADASDRGYVFEHTRVQSECGLVSLGRSWNNAPQCVFLNTVFDFSAGAFEVTGNGIKRWTVEAMNALPKLFGEFNTTDAEGQVISPEANEVTFTFKEASKQMNTILSAEEAARFTMDYTLGEWSSTAKEDAEQVVCDLNNIEADGIYLIEYEGGDCEIQNGSTFSPSVGIPFTVRKANARGGFGWRAGEEPHDGLDNTDACNCKVEKFIREGQLIIVKNNKEYNVYGMAL